MLLVIIVSMSLRIQFLVWGLVAFLDVTLKTARSEAQGDEVPLSVKMHAMADTMSDLWGVMLKPRKLENEKEKAKALEKARSLKHLAHGILEGMADPGAIVIAGYLVTNIDELVSLIENSEPDYGRRVFKSILHTCMSCHVRVNTKLTTVLVEKFAKDKELRRDERAEYLAATRNFDGATKEYAALAADKKYAKEFPAAWAEAVYRGLALSFRMKSDPDELIQIASKALEAKEIPSFVQSDLISWKIAAEAWKSESKKSFSSAATLLKEIERLIAKGGQNRHFPMETHGTLYFLRAATLGHEFVRVYPKDKRLAQVYGALGEAYEATSELDDWSLHEQYYDSCIRAEPHSEIAMKCFQKLERATYHSLDASKENPLPDVFKDHLDVLKDLAGPKADSKTNQRKL